MEIEMKVADQTKNNHNADLNSEADDENLIHQDVKYKCESCFRLKKRALSKHIENFHAGPHSCQFCSYSFKHSVLLEAHLIKVHEKNKKSSVEQIFKMEKTSAQVKVIAGSKRFPGPKLLLKKF